jgi:hypothetical protein
VINAQEFLLVIALGPGKPDWLGQSSIHMYILVYYGFSYIIFREESVYLRARSADRRTFMATPRQKLGRPSTGKITVQLRMALATKEQLARLALQEHESISEYVETVLVRHLKTRSK